MNSFLNELNSLLPLISLFCSYGYGRLVGIRSPVLACVTGIVWQGFIVASVVTFNAAMGATFIKIFLYTGAIITIYFIQRSIRRTSISKRTGVRNNNIRYFLGLYTVVIFSAASMFFYINPESTYIHDLNNEKIEFQFTPEMSYYSVQSQEILNADYNSRLRIANQYPKEWGAYHLLTAATEALLSAFLPETNLLTYLKVKSIIYILIFIALVEYIILRFKRSWLTVAFVLGWSILGLSLFRPTIAWHATTNGPYSILYCGIMLLMAAEKRYLHVMIALIFLASSVARLLPLLVIPGSIVLIWLVYENRNRLRFTLKRILKQISITLIPAGLYNLSLVYSIVRFGAPLPPARTELFNESWLCDLMVYKITGNFINWLGGEAYYSSTNCFMYFRGWYSTELLNGIFLVSSVFLFIRHWKAANRRSIVLLLSVIVTVASFIFLAAKVHETNSFETLNILMIVIIYTLIATLPLTFIKSSKPQLKHVFPALIVCSGIIVLVTVSRLHISYPVFTLLAGALSWFMLPYVFRLTGFNRTNMTMFLCMTLFSLGFIHFEPNLTYIEEKRRVDITGIYGDSGEKGPLHAWNGFYISSPTETPLEIDCRSALMGVRVLYKPGTTSQFKTAEFIANE